MNLRYLTNITLLLLVLSTALLLSLYQQSQFHLSVNDVLGLFFTPDENNIKQQVIYTLRLPRSLAACLIGFNLGLAGALMQGLTRNPLASPTLFAINSGAACFMALTSVGFTLFTQLPLPIITFMGALFGGLLVFLLGAGFKQQHNPLRLILAGIAINALLASLTRAALIISDDMAFSLLHWLSGSLSELGWQSWHQLWPLSLLGIFLAFSNCRGLNLIAMGEESAQSVGLNIRNLRLRVCLAVLILSAISVTLAGPIAFVGLIAPHVCRALFNVNHFLVLPFSGVIGAVIVCSADLLSRFIIPPSETPAGIITALIGTPFFIYLALKEPAS